MGPNDVWAVGSMIGHWNGTQWSIAPNPEVPGTTGVVMRSLAKVGPCDAWAVGGSFDGDGAESALSVRLTAGGGAVNQAPVAVASATPTSGPGPLAVQFSTAGSHDPDGAIVSYLWDFGDSSYPPNRTDANPAHTYLQTGVLTYHAVVQIRDDRGAVAQANVTIQITPGGNVSVETTGPLELALRVSPSPARGACSIELSLPAMETVHVRILDASGRQVRDLGAAALAAGRHVIPWNGLDDAGRAVRAGIYFATAQVGTQRISARVARVQ
jgi:hypothetical protein